MSPIAYGRNLPLTDWEGDDFTPGAGGAYVSCMDTAVGRMLYWATNGRKNLDGKQIRAAVKPADPNGITFEQANQAVHSLTGLNVLYANESQHWIENWLINRGHGLVIAGNYSAIPRQYRFQAAANFRHAIFIIGQGPAGNTREYDPLDPRIHLYGEINIPMSAIWPFVASLNGLVGYIPLQHV
jgi:hypothetical protein